MTITVGIVNWNGKKYLRKCLEHVIAQELYPERIKIVILDNGSEDDSIADIRDMISEYDIMTIMSDVNLGFAQGHNRIIMEVTTNFYLPLNFDVFLDPNYIKEILSEIDEDETVGMATGKLRKMVNFIPQMVLDSTGIEMPYYWPRARGEMNEDKGQYDISSCRYIFGPCGAAPIYRVKMLKEIHYKGEYFDKDFFNYVEDVDLAWRAQLRGWKGIYVPQAIGYHERGATRKNNPSEQQQYFLRGFQNRYLTLYKNISSGELRQHGFKLIMKELLFLISSNDGGVSRRIKVRSIISAYKARHFFKEKRAIIQSNSMTFSGPDMDFSGFREFSLIRFVCGKISVFLYIKLIKIYHIALRYFYRILTALNHLFCLGRGLAGGLKRRIRNVVKKI